MAHRRNITFLRNIWFEILTKATENPEEKKQFCKGEMLHINIFIKGEVSVLCVKVKFWSGLRYKTPCVQRRQCGFEQN